MTVDARLLDEYGRAMQDYLRHGDEASMLRAFELGREAIQSDVGLLEIVQLQRDTTHGISGAAGYDASPRDPWGFFLEVLGGYELIYRGYRDSVSHLSNTLKELRLKTGLLEQANAQLQKEVDGRREAEAASEAAREEAVSANAAKSEFLSRMSHELRTPLNAVIGFAQLIEMSAPPGDAQEEHAEEILRAARHLLELINEILDIGRIEVGAFTLSMEAVCLRETIEEAIALVSTAADAKHVNIRAGGDEAWVHADRQRLRQVLGNLLSNAVKYNRESGDVTIDWRAEADGRVRASVADTGRGIPPNALPLLFVPFERLGAEATDIEGTGLGLALSKAFVEAMDGSIDATSALGRGSVFTVSLQAARPGSLPTASSEPSPRVRPGVLESSRLLLVEDNPSNIILMRRICDHAGAALQVATSGADALRALEEGTPDLVLLDLHLPDTDGVDLLRRIRTRPDPARLPIVVLTADASRATTKRLLADGVDAYLTKPLDVPQFLVTIAGILADERPA